MLAVTACNKNQRVVKDLEGTWTITSYKLNGAEFIGGGLSATYQWNNCKVKNEDCSGVFTVEYPGTSPDVTSFTYNIKSDGTIINIDFADTLAADISNAAITNQTDTQFSFTGTDSDGDNIQVTLMKN